ncbi:MAG: PAS domain-containing protein [Deltaproteobacteria bacterium]|nr:PAS domain-containing protein [Deltaproteobacteria bacterium]
MELADKSLLPKPINPWAEYRRQHDELQILFDISSALHSSPHLEDVLQRALTSISGTLKLKMAALYLVKEVFDDYWLLELAAHHGFTATLINCIQSLSISTEVINRFYYLKPVKWFPTRKLVFAKLRERMDEVNVQEIICIALMTQKRVLGLLYVTNDQLMLGREKREFLSTIGHMIGVAIENAKLFESVERAKSELEITFDAIQHSIFIIDPKLQVLRVNKTSETIYGKGESIVGRKYTKVLYNQDHPHPECPIWACLWRAEPVRREGPHPRWGGYYHYYAFPVLNKAGTLERVVYYEKDMTEARKLEQRMHQSERLKALGTLAAGIAHEIRNPLATINFNTQLLHRELALEPSQAQMFQDIFLEIKKIDRIVQQVLQFAKPREPQFLPNQLNEVVQYCQDLSKAYLRKTKIEFVTELAEDIPPLVMDFNQISQVIMNLLINAIEAMPDGGRITLKTYRQQDSMSVVFEVCDTGPGIMDEDRERIFDPFFTRKSEGTGLGLSISRQILEKHGAFIEMESPAGGGAIFRVVFPESAESPPR